VVRESVAARFGRVLREQVLADDVLTCPDTDDRADPAWPAALAAVRGRGFDACVVDPSSRGLTARDAAATGIPVRVGLPTGGDADRLLTHPMRLPRPVFGRPDLYEFAVALAGALTLPDVPRPDAMVPPLPTRPEQVVALELPRPLVALHPGGARQWNRRWPLDRFAELGARLAGVAGAALVVLGDPADRQDVAVLADGVRAEVPGARVRAECDLGLNPLALLLAGCDLLVGNDSGPAHVAAAMGTPTVVLYGPTGTEFLWTRVYPRHVGVGLRYPCQSITNVDFPEGHTPCEHRCARAYAGPAGPYPRCLADIPTDRVWDVVSRRVHPREQAGRR
jgi:glycosyl transferase protein BlmE